MYIEQPEGFFCVCFFLFFLLSIKVELLFKLNQSELSLRRVTMCYITPLYTLLSFPPRALIWYSDAGISSPALTMGKFITGKWEHQVAICNLSNLSRVFQSLTMETKLPINILKLGTVKMALPQLWTTNPLRRHQESYSFEGSKSIHLMDRDLLSNLFGPYPVGGQLESRLPRWSQIKGNGALQADISEMEDPGCGYPGLWFNKLPLFVARTKDFLYWHWMLW